MIMTNVIESLILLIPLIIAGVLHMICVRLDLLSCLKIPISTKHFGKNKTYRGIMLMSLFAWWGVVITAQLEPMMAKTSLSFASLSSWELLLFGVTLGLGYTLSELPNSYYKRSHGIAEGKLPSTTKAKIIHAIIDQADSGVGCILAYVLFLKPPLVSILIFVFIGTFTHLFFNVLLFLLKLRKEPF
ncbi:MAG: hypothetical protein HQK52_16740 [Oligoflexia bacterium]|nr:hypothetical protein [Oligoflexia bacterium]